MDEEIAPADASFADMDNFMDSAYDKLEAGETDAPDSEISEEQITAVVEAETNSEPADVDTDTTAESEEDPETPDEVEDTGEPDESQTIAAPQSMSAKDREAFAALPPESQKWLSDRAKEQEAAFTQKTMDLAEKSKSYDKLEQVIAPRRQQLAMDGMDEGTAVGQLFALSDFANKDPVGFVKYLFNSRGIPLDAIGQSDDGQGPVDPQLAAMQNKLQGLETVITQQQSHAQQAAATAIESEVQKFAEANEHYAELENDMIPVVAALCQQNPSLSPADALAKAYTMAIAANPSVSAKVEAEKSAKAEADKVAMAKARAAKSKKAAASNVVRSGTRSAAKGGAENVDDFIGGLVDERMTA